MKLQTNPPLRLKKVLAREVLILVGCAVVIASTWTFLTLRDKHYAQGAEYSLRYNRAYELESLMLISENDESLELLYNRLRENRANKIYKLIAPLGHFKHREEFISVIKDQKSAKEYYQEALVYENLFRSKENFCDSLGILIQDLEGFKKQIYLYPEEVFELFGKDPRFIALYPNFDSFRKKLKLEQIEDLSNKIKAGSKLIEDYQSKLKGKKGVFTSTQNLALIMLALVYLIRPIFFVVRWSINTLRSH
jgi:hypothetical protein